MVTTNLTIGGTCFVLLSTESFPGKVMELRDDWVRVMGHGQNENTWFDEWFAIKADKCRVIPS